MMKMSLLTLTAALAIFLVSPVSAGKKEAQDLGAAGRAPAPLAARRRVADAAPHHRRLEAEGHTLRLVGMLRTVRRSFELAGLDQVLVLDHI